MKSFSLHVIALVGALSPLAAQQTSLLPYLPKHTIAAVSAPDLSASMAELRQMPMAKMYAEEEVQNFLADVQAMVHSEIDKALEQAREMHAQGQLPVDPDQILQLSMRGVTLALTQLGLEMGDFGPQPKFGVVAHLDFGPSAPQWRQLLEIGLSMLEQQAGPQLLKTEAKVGDWQMTSFTPNDVQDSPMGLSMVWLPEGLLLGTLADEVRGIAQNLLDKEPALASSESFQAATKHLPTEGAELISFSRYDPFIDFGIDALRFAAEMDPDMAMIDLDGVDRALTAMGLRKLPVDVATSSYVAGKSVTRTFRATREGAHTAAAPVLDMSFLKWVPKDAVSFMAGTFEFTSLYDKLLKGLQAYDAEMANQMLAQLAQVEEQIGFKVRDDLFGSIGDHYISWQMPVATITSAPEVALLLKVNDPERLVTVLRSLSKLSDGVVDLEENEKRGLKVYQLRVNVDPNQGFGMNPFEMLMPHFAFKDGYLVGGFSANDIKRVFQRMDREDEPKGDIRSNREFAAVSANLPTGLDSVSFTDWKASFESIYQIATGLLAFVPIGEEIPIDMSLLPDSATLTQHLFGAVSYGRPVEGGYETEAISPFGPELGLLFGAGVGAAAATLGMMRTRGF